MKRKKPKKTRKPRKPISLRATPEDEGCFAIGLRMIVTPHEINNLKPRQARKLANWLTRASDWLESQ